MDRQPAILSSELLGFRPAARVLIVNADDLGMYPSLNIAVVRYSFSLDVDTKRGRYRQLIHELPAGLSEWAVHPGLDDVASRAIDSGLRVRHTPTWTS